MGFMLSAFLLPLFAQAAAAQSAGRAQADARAPSEIVAAAPASDWVAIGADDLLVMDLAPDPAGKPRLVVIQLISPLFSQGWVANVRTLARAHWWDGLSVNRVQDNYVAQWGDASEKKPLPAGLTVVPENGYAGFLPPDNLQPIPMLDARGQVIGSSPPQERPRGFSSSRTPYAAGEWIAGGWPQATDGDRVWPIHCYGMVGVGRNLSPNTGTGAELYAVIGHAPRHLDRNIAVVGRVVEGIENLSSLPRGTEALGFYKVEAERTPIRSVRLASDLPEGKRPRFEYLSTESATFAAYADARANRRDAFFIRPAGGADVCNVPVPVRRAK